MAEIPKGVKDLSLVQSLKRRRIAQGKVQDVYTLLGFPYLLLLIATDRISIFDFVLNATIPSKGEVLAALRHFAFYRSEIPNHFVHSETRSNNNMAWDLRGTYPDLPLTRACVVKKAKPMPYEFIFRRHLGGSRWNEYQTTGMVAGNKLPAGLRKWERLESSIFTPSTKEDGAHDENISCQEFFERTGEEGEKAVNMLQKVYDKSYEHLRTAGILALDFKGEVGHSLKYNKLMVIDEVMTPDCCRFVLETEWENAMREGREPEFLDKQVVRNWGLTVETPFYDEQEERIIGLDKLEPMNPQHLAFAHSLKVPEDVIQETTARYLFIFEKITGDNLKDYQKNNGLVAERQTEIWNLA